ncbi:MmgE/PrpD family protein [Szabonella alba]|uniref:MmgE/PrpD family protein n=1 Tax=Szabonella alba TaxID=2804194 RepID=A0A8K0Y2E8_9RHOB|nr:MmgE/PrpD family protein [Szabonella alba]MBL4919232.1 MmgE/PrpD family protein [Szabonella alba]
MTDKFGSSGAHLAKMLVGLQPPAPVLHRVRGFILDSLGVILAARAARGMPGLVSAMTALDPSTGPATELLTGRRVSGPTAALLNGAAAHALEFDDTDDIARIHAYCVVLPAALAVAGTEPDIDERRFTEAVALGVEVFCRLGLAAPGLLATGWHPTTGIGSIAGAVTAARLLGLDVNGLLQAMGLAYAQLCGTTQPIADNALAKRIGPGFAARNGLTAAYMARAGLTGPRRFLDGAAGFFALYGGDDAEPAMLLDGLGRDWMLERVSVKPFPCCRCTHTLIQIGIDLHRSGLRMADVVGGELRLGRVNWGIVNAPFDPAAAPDPVVHAQFNATYCFARALDHGSVGLESFHPEVILSPEAARAGRFATIDADDIPANSLPVAEVRLRLADGQERRMRHEVLPGSPLAPLSEAALRAKFAANLAHGGHPADAGALADQILAGGTSLRPLIATLAAQREALPA